MTQSEPEELAEIMYEKSIELLNRAVAEEMWAVHQYMYFHFHFDDQGYDLLAAVFKRTAIDEMMHAEQLAERILFLKGDVELKVSKDISKVHEVREMLEMAMRMEQDAIRDYNAWANECAANADSASKQIFEALVGDEEMHMDRFETQLDHLDRFGEQFLALQSIERAKSMAAGTGGEQG
jgi:bacterioferritin